MSQVLFPHVNDFWFLTFQIVDPKTGDEKPITVSVDDGIRPSTTLSGLAKLKPVFKQDGSTTAGTIFTPLRFFFVLFVIVNSVLHLCLNRKL